MEKSDIGSNRDTFLLDKKPKKEFSSENNILRKYIKDKLKLSAIQIKQIIERAEILLPVSIFKNKLSTLEIVVKYLKEVNKLDFTEISKILNRDQRTIWHAYQRSLKKHSKITVIDSKMKSSHNLSCEFPERISTKKVSIHPITGSCGYSAFLSIKIPVSIFSNRKYSALEALVAHLKDSHNHKFVKIAELLDLSPKTVWTVYQRTKKKNVK